mmetsp:Transcript_12502/g.33737  ORF Transcript_12502/g.33737 Transcript_12502/m.33737 type:complete len:150 (-) Transcript_12502:235-684(-)
MRAPRWDVEHVACEQSHIEFHVKTSVENAHANIGYETLLRHGQLSRGKTPASTAGGLDKKDIVIVDMRTYSAALCGVRHHDVIDTPIGHKRKVSLQGCDLGNVSVDLIYKKRIVLRRQLREGVFCEGTISQLKVALAVLQNQARLSIRV